MTARVMRATSFQGRPASRSLGRVGGPPVLKLLRTRCSLAVRWAPSEGWSG